MKKQIFLCILLVVLLGFLPSPFIHPPRFPPEARVATENAKAIYIALCEFENVYGHFPSTKIPEDLQSKYPQQNRTDSNYILGQLIAAGLLESEELFTIKSPTRCDNDISTPEKILEAGECQFSYISQAGEHPYSSSYGSPQLPILIFPMVPGTEKFDATFYEKQQEHGFYLSLYGDIRKVNINQAGQGILRGQTNTTLFTFGEDTVWGEDKPLLHHPLPYDGEPSANSAPSNGEKPLPLPIEKSYSLIVGTFVIGLTIIFYFLQRWRNQSFATKKGNSV